MRSRATSGRVASMMALLVLAGCGSAPAPAPDPDTAGGRSLQESCPVLGQALRRGMVDAQDLSRIADRADSLARDGDRQTSRTLASLPDDARALAASPDSQSALVTFERDVTSVQRACTRLGSPMTY